MAWQPSTGEIQSLLPFLLYNTKAVKATKNGWNSGHKHLVCSISKATLGRVGTQKGRIGKIADCNSSDSLIGGDKRGIKVYLKKVYFAGRTAEIHKTFTKRYGKNASRGKNVNRTPEAVAKYNEKMAFRELTRTINENFDPKDIHLVLTYRKGERPTPEQAKKDRIKFTRQLRRYFKARGMELKYIAVTAFGDRGAIHHHLIINTMDARDLRGIWPHGGSHCEYLYDSGEYSALAWYFVKQAKKSPKGEEAILGRRWSGSKNLKRVEPKIEEVDAKTWKEPPAPLPGYVIDIDSIEADCSPVTGIPYLFYRMIKIPADRKAMKPDGTSLKGDSAARWIHDENRKKVKNEWSKQNDTGTIQKVTVPRRPRKKSGKANSGKKKP